MVKTDYIEQRITSSQKAFSAWKNSSFSHRKKILLNTAKILRMEKERLAKIINSEMYKKIDDAKSEIEKCAIVCEYYANNSQSFLEDEIITTEATKSFVKFEPLGIVFAIMPWNFPFWQVFRFASPALMAGNTCLLKHSSNVNKCSKEIEKIFLKAGLPKNTFISLIIPSKDVETVISNKNVKAITLTGSEDAGKNVAQLSGKYLKKVVLELGGSDPFIVFKDADIKKAAISAATSRMIVSGQSCISAKRFIIEKSIYKDFVKLFKEELTKIDICPLITKEAEKKLDIQVKESVRQGAKIINQNPIILANIQKDMPVWKEETFGPISPIMTFNNDIQALEIANDSKFGLGASVWTQNKKRINFFVSNLQAGTVFINAFVKSDPRIPFGGTKASGFGRELSLYGIKEFVNIKSVWIA